ncbi:MAG: formylglycine-generating enzyme family protein [Desulfovibrio sp.]|nr:formylglycine-generating enzyme family protein [Desulfovibrio sp.]
MRTNTISLLVLGLTLLCADPAHALFGIGEKTHTNSIGMEFVLIPAGSFLQEVNIVNEFNEKLYNPKMTVSKPFYLGKYEVTQEQWVAVMGNNPARVKGRTNPVENVSWNDVQEFIKRLNAKEKHNRYRLPTEAEWELAARGGTETMFFFMKKDEGTWADAARQLDAYAWFKMNSGETTHTVGQKKPNQYGLYDVYGNVWEWVQDYWHEDWPQDREITDYRGPASGSYRVFRGGDWSRDAEYCRSAFRYYNGSPGLLTSDVIGFRLALSPE